MKEILLTLDVAHPPRHPELVEAELLEAWHTARNRSDVRVIKIIHGHGSSGRGGSTRDIARNWLHRNRNRFRAIIDGERYSLTDQVDERSSAGKSDRMPITILIGETAGLRWCGSGDVVAPNGEDR